MRVRLALDDGLLAVAKALTGVEDTSAVVRQALEALIEREHSRRRSRLREMEPAFAAVWSNPEDSAYDDL